MSDSAADAAKAVTLFGWFLRLAGYSDLKREPAGGTDDLITVFERARVTHAIADVNMAKTAHFETLAQLLRRDPIEFLFRAVFEALMLTITVSVAGAGTHIETPDLAQGQGVQRLWSALQVVETLGVPVKTAVDATGIIVLGSHRRNDST